MCFHNKKGNRGCVLINKELKKLPIDLIEEEPNNS